MAKIPQPLAEADHLLAGLDISTNGRNAYREFDRVLSALLDRLGPSRILEVGGGRSPLGIRLGLGDSLVVNDISAHELGLLPPDVLTCRFDISDPATVPDDANGSFDFVFSRSVLEHVGSVNRAMSTTSNLLRPGGVGFHFFPTLYVSPFVINKVFPYWLTRPLVHRILQPTYERFPATYKQARSTDRQLDTWRSLGFERVEAHRFFDHNYYRRVPLVRSVESGVSGLAQRRHWHWYSSYAFILVVK